MSQTFRGIDDTVERSRRERERLMREPATSDRAARISELFDIEAHAWSQLFEITSVRPVWRAALVAEVVARRQARRWGARAAELIDDACRAPLTETVAAERGAVTWTASEC